MNKLATSAQVRVTTPDATAAQTLASYSGQVAAQRAITIGSTSDALCLVRMPGETTNRFSAKPGLVKELRDLLEQSKGSGRTRP